jgi:hypothetical protein
MGLMTGRLRADLEDEYSQVMLFEPDFYTEEMWKRDVRLLKAEGEPLSQKEREQFDEEYVRRYIRQVKKLHNNDRDM